MAKFRVRGEIVDIPDELGQIERRTYLRENYPSVYREVYLGQDPDMEQFAAQARREGALQVAREYGPIGAGLVGMGATGTRLLRGVQEIGARAVGSDDTVRRVQQRRADDEEAMRGIRETSPVATFVGESLPYLAVPSGAFAGAAGRVVGGVGSRLGQQGARSLGSRMAGSGALDAALAGTTLGALESGGDRAAMATGAITGAFGGILGDRVARSLAARNPTPANTVADRAAEMGYRISPSERYSMTPAIAKFENVLEKWPLIHSGIGSKIRNQNQKFLDRNLREALGIPDNAPLTRQVLKDVAKATDDPYVYPVAWTVELNDELADIAARQTKVAGVPTEVIPTSVKGVKIRERVVNPQSKKIDDLIDALEDGGLDADQARIAIQDFEKLADSNTGDLARSYRDVIKVLRNAIRDQHGDVASQAIDMSLERNRLAKGVMDSFISGKETAVDYRRLLTKYYRDKHRDLPSPSGMKGLLETGEALEGTGALDIDFTPRHSLGLTSTDLQPSTFAERVAYSPATAAVTGGTLFGPAGFGLAAAGPTLGALHYSGLTPRMMDRGILGSMVSRDFLENTMNPLAERAGRAGGLGFMLGGGG